MSFKLIGLYDRLKKEDSTFSNDNIIYYDASCDDGEPLLEVRNDSTGETRCLCFGEKPLGFGISEVAKQLWFAGNYGTCIISTVDLSVVDGWRTKGQTRFLVPWKDGFINIGDSNNFTWLKWENHRWCTYEFKKLIYYELFNIDFVDVDSEAENTMFDLKFNSFISFSTSQETITFKAQKDNKTWTKNYVNQDLEKMMFKLKDIESGYLDYNDDVPF